MQSRRLSAAEAVANVVVGYGVAAATTALVLPLWGFDVGGVDALWISAVFTVVSLARSYLLRRLFNSLG